jgi:hypothetical protein
MGTRPLWLGVGLAIAAVFGVPVPAAAAPVTWVFTGVLRSATYPGPPPAELTSLGVVVGAPVTAWYQFESDIPDTRPDPNFGRYEQSILGAELTIGSWTLALSAPNLPGNDIFITRNAPDVTGQFNVIDVGSVAGSSFFSVVLATHLPEIYPSDALLLVPPPLEALTPYGVISPNSTYGTNIEFYALGLGGGQYHIEITGLALAEPASALLWLASLGALLLAHSRPSRVSLARLRLTDRRTHHSSGSALLLTRAARSKSA